MRRALLLLLLGGCEWVQLPEDNAVYDVDGDGFEARSDCDDHNSRVHPLATETCNGTDNNCSGSEDDASDATYWFPDADGDGWGDPAAAVRACDAPSGHVSLPYDCDDADAATFPGAPEVSCTDNVDRNCDGRSNTDDLDGDGYSACVDCDDAEPRRNPGALEQCNGVDDNCDGVLDDGLPLLTWYPDADGDGWGAAGAAVEACARPDGYSVDATDCDDGDATVFPDAPEACDGLDNNCNTVVDEYDPAGNDRWYTDADGDGAAGADDWIASCTPVDGRQNEATDCDDSDPDVSPLASERCNEIDDDCDGTADEAPVIDGTTWYRDTDGDSWGVATTTLEACNQPAGYAAWVGDCDETRRDTNPGSFERCGGVDENCDGVTDEDDAIDALPWYGDTDGDGYGGAGDILYACTQIAGRYAEDDDCDDADPNVHPDALEIDCSDPTDYNCDGSTGHDDADADGWEACEDCDDADGSRNPAVEETCDGLDQDCDGVVDNGADDASTWYPDADADGYGVDGTGTIVCTPPSGWVTVAGDCDDTDVSVSPGASETCGTSIDDDCDGEWNTGAVDCTDWYTDLDADGFGSETSACLCEPDAPWTEATDGDCDDGDPAVNPDAAEVCGNGVDDDCDDAADACGVAGTRALADADAVFYGAAARDGFAGQLLSAGDIDGDGFDDLLVAARGDDTAGAEAGAVYLFAGPLPAVGSPADALYTWTGAAPGDTAGYALAIGDLDGDGVTDLVIGADGVDGGGTDAGAIHLLLGPLTGGSLAAADGTWDGIDTNDCAGCALAVLPDFDGDGVSELAVGAHRETLVSGGAGAVYVFDSAPTGAGALGTTGATIAGSGSGDFFGRSVVSAGDNDGDGLGDVLIGAYGNDDGGSNAGAVWLYCGPLTGSLSVSDATAERMGPASGVNAGRGLTGGGDLDGDGYDDFVVGAPNADDEASNAGAVYVVFGPTTGTADLSTADATLLGLETYDSIGSTLTFADLNTDGVLDIVVGGEGNAFGGTGAAWVFYGPVTGTRTTEQAEATFYGEDATDAAATAFIGAGDTDGDGFEDLLVGAASEDSVGSDAGAAYLILGGPGL